MNNCVIYDFETLSQDPHTGVAVCLALLSYDETRFTTNPYTWDELLTECKFIKFDVEEQTTKYNRKIQKSTLDWWAKQPPEARKLLIPTSADQPLEALDTFMTTNIDLENLEKVYTRGNTFDPVFMTSLYTAIGKDEVLPWWSIRDTRSMIDGMAWGADLNNKFFPNGLEAKFIGHDPSHDISMDVMRMQTLAQVIGS